MSQSPSESDKKQWLFQKRKKKNRYIQRCRENVLYNIWYTVSEGQGPQTKVPSSQSRAPFKWWSALQFQEIPSPVIIHIPFKKAPKFLEIYMRLKTDCSKEFNSHDHTQMTPSAAFIVYLYKKQTNLRKYSHLKKNKSRETE